MTVDTAKPQTIREVMSVAGGWLTERGIEEARLDTEVLLAHALGVPRLSLYLDHDRPLRPEELGRFRSLMKRRAAREPVAYIVGQRGFFGLDLEVGPGVLVPRPETEHLVEVGFEELKRIVGAGRAAPRFVDVGTGSGCVALALVSEAKKGAVAPDLSGLMSDVSAEALAIAGRNAAACGLARQVSLLRGHLLAAVADGSLDLVLSNPPYVTPAEESLLAPEILDHEPRGALFDAEGLPLTAALVRDAARVLRPGGALALETGFDKADLVASFFEAAGFREVRRVRDLGGHERVVVGRR